MRPRMTNKYMGWNSKFSAFVLGDLPLVILHDGDDGFCTLTGADARHFRILHTEISQHLMGMKKQDWVTEFMADIEDDSHSVNVYTKLFEKFFKSEHI